MTTISKRSPTMTDVAKLAGVSQTTVSFVINDVSSVRISSETRRRVWEAVEKLGYRPNRAAQGLRTRRSDILGFVTDEIATSPFAGDTIKGAQDVAWENGKTLLLLNTGGIPEVEKAAVESMLEKQVEGIVFAAMFTRMVDPPPNIHDTPTVLMNCYSADHALPSVIPDEVRGGRTATEILLAAGHRRIAFINGEAWMDAAIDRLTGYQYALEAAGLPCDEALVRHGNWRPDSGYEHTMSLMQLPNPPTAIFCGNDLIALGAYEALKELGLRIPEDVSVMGYDDQEIATYLMPPLSTMALPHYEMGQWAVAHLLEQIGRSDRLAPIQEKLECPFIERKSIRSTN